MSDNVKILVDAMGGDNAPEAAVKGCIDAINEKDGFEIILIGDEAKIKSILESNKFSSDRLKIQHAQEVITMEDTPTRAIRTKKDSSMVVGFNMLKEKSGDVFLSAGNTGALMAGSLFILGRIKGVDRPALATILPTKKNGVLLIDSGANPLCKPINFVQFAIMGYIYMRDVFGIKNPRVGLINVGSEDKKGNETIKQAHELLSKSNINFSGNIEGKDIPEGKVDVAVCDGFVGNIILKYTEGIGSFLFGEIKNIFGKNIISKLSALIVKNGLKAFKKKLDPSEYGGAPLLGVNGKVMKAHGNSNAKAFKNAVFKAYSFARSTIVEQIEEDFTNMEVEDSEQ
ncbi:phosphate--acyl-ACP acyltransferase [Clostridium thermosuccinogenes]|jgi:glycerol-3-phosphate acyltransferase PlsX|uniref:Phosphate acyltransferase n=1 Tax=Clostridium thermosuccinogenes TaxID=84032 RepID=A0A2K2FG63_9CLOT|nr:phosphate acyltransferase PlsX [Pseudoclostridium thermosuccinogenes]AUS96454.1 phosphate--acyl-ACP acyltransferase [Pseudoclostridium thermosuccinogenes]PNT92882.1 phosphate--acyl-ACP acyltransferase [Pseudoclostridium thermosuccinogenes]PNT97774.1 phosphate--acyl-ACP acyltransferase [Pseudoclostridium thermosuccinogenes]PNT99764.1 phosphate--acyl-ACP acyltransferase [Pseudoclostridium thermosuccinogenes]